MEWGCGGRGTQTTSFPTVTKKIEMEASFSGAGKWTGVCGEVCVCRLFGGWGWGGAEKSRWRYSIALQSSKHAELCTEL